MTGPFNFHSHAINVLRRRESSRRLAGFHTYNTWRLGRHDARAQMFCNCLMLLSNLVCASASPRGSHSSVVLQIANDQILLLLWQQIFADNPSTLLIHLPAVYFRRPGERYAQACHQFTAPSPYCVGILCEAIAELWMAVIKESRRSFWGSSRHALW